jgi:hypothetical protein
MQDHRFEVRMYSRDTQTGMQLMFVDHAGQERVVAQFGGLGEPQPPVTDVQLTPAPPARRQPWSLNQLLDRASDPEEKTDTEQPESASLSPVPELEPTPITEPAPPVPVFTGEMGMVEAERPIDDTARRRAAKAHIRRIAAAFAFEANTEALRYEQALLAHNGNIAAIQDLEMEAMAAGVSVQKLAEKIIDGRRLHSRRMLRVKTVHDDALKALDAAQGDAIRMIEREAVAQMNGEPNASVDA